MQVTLGMCDADPKTVDKRPYFKNQRNVNVQIFDGCSLENPRLKMRINELQKSNYAYIPEWGFYYYIGNPDVLNGEMCVLPLTKDLLTSNADDILNLKVNVSRSQAKRSAYVIDSNIITSVKNTVQTFQFNASPFGVPESDYCWVMAVVGGNI